MDNIDLITQLIMHAVKCSNMNNMVHFSIVLLAKQLSVCVDSYTDVYTYIGNYIFLLSGFNYHSDWYALSHQENNYNQAFRIDCGR